MVGWYLCGKIIGKNSSSKVWNTNGMIAISLDEINSKLKGKWICGEKRLDTHGYPIGITITYSFRDTIVEETTILHSNNTTLKESYSYEIKPLNKTDKKRYQILYKDKLLSNTKKLWWTKEGSIIDDKKCIPEK